MRPDTYFKLIQRRHYVGRSKNKNLNNYSIDGDVRVLSKKSQIF